MNPSLRLFGTVEESSKKAEKQDRAMDGKKSREEKRQQKRREDSRHQDRGTNSRVFARGHIPAS